MDVSNEISRVCLEVALGGGSFGRGGESSLVVEAIQVASSILELFHPAFGLSNHHVAVECASAVRIGGGLNMRADFGDNRWTKGDIGNKMAIP